MTIEERDIQPEKKNMVADDKVDKAIEKEALAASGDEYVEVIPSEELEKPVAPKDPRMEIAEKHEKRMEEQRKNTEIKDEPKEEKKAEEVDLTKNEGQTLVKVGGVESWVDNEKIDNAGSVQAYQKERAVQQGFQDVAKERKLLEKQQNDFIKQQEAFAAKQKQPPPDVAKEEQNLSSQDDLKSKNVAELIKIEHTALVDGDDEASTAAALELHERRGIPAIDQKQVVAEVTEQVAKTTEAKERAKVITDARDVFYEAHPEVKSDPRLLDMVDQETNLVMKNNQELKTPGEILEKAYNNIALWKGNKPSNLNARREEKRQLKQPESSNGRVSSTPEPTHETKSEYVQSLRKQRGLE